ncbi:unnamed protein product [Aphanomyces euteiches]|uniref:Uncharacterized protein n=1 Tax=Aphanomyces euteiches TaxID=100861 RepID=A0A6G0WPZ0_9STRA|nr:hypothetical protein Ae201684_012981 [Aphanomyces euteiches]KAH9153304.1 hypothetical protein AeRB84_004418 [Aphanomyces euteiches]
MAGEEQSSKSHERLHLKIQPGPPKFPFKGHSFEITVYLVDDSEHLKTGLVMPLQIDLLVGDKTISSDKPLVKIDPTTKPLINGDGMCRLMLSIEETSMQHGNKKFQFLLTPLGDFEVAPIMSTDMTCITHRLMIQEELPELWYKDEGGRDKCMNLPVHLVDATNQPVPRAVPLRVTLLYESEHPVLKQDILKLSPDSQRLIDSHGQALLKLRIEDVSKNHQGQAFRLKVEPDTAQSPLFFDVAPDWSTPISVRSKRNKRRGGPIPSPHVIASSSSGIDPLDSPREGEDPRPVKRTISPSTASGPLHPSMESILRWTSSVVQGLQQLEWQPIGYETRLDGGIDKDRPIYRCPACWRYKDVMTMDTQQHEGKCLIANVLLTYATDTMGHLDTLLKMTEKMQSSMPSTSNAPNPGASMGPPTLTRGITDMVNSLEVPPTLFRGASGGLSEFMMGDDHHHNSSFMQQTEAIVQAIERQVFFVVARMFPVGQSAYAGFPAFDHSLTLLGFYQEGQGNGSGSATQINFVPINDVHGLTQYEVMQCQQLVRRELKDNSDAVKRIDRDGNNDLDKLKENALIFYWSSTAKASQPPSTSSARSNWNV